MSRRKILKFVSVAMIRVPTVREKIGKMKIFKVREKSGNFSLVREFINFGKSQGILDSEVMVEKSGYKRNKRK